MSIPIPVVGATSNRTKQKGVQTLVKVGIEFVMTNGSGAGTRLDSYRDLDVEAECVLAGRFPNQLHAQLLSPFHVLWLHHGAFVLLGAY
eukprot:CAMPEP_0176471936 /NCGR_PEP_ID=MMETSP0127-20121128/41442_1 /TAXON_ID=938130 /ORGANISM="Platyophrya macrostoma, Strain WH" /LENGTH=88 /DNA_ID=CAMNT_0017866705 /DNA_START=201 /DNA_END=464 /DNA_ORIENTATION=+